MNSKNKVPDISYYRLSLTDFLKESHPELLIDNAFITARSELAAEIYSQAVRNGSNQIEAGEQANAVLFEDLHFSIHNTLTNILWNEFSDLIPEEDAKPWAILLFPECEHVFAEYTLSDDFAYEPEYESLYTELTGVIANYFEEHGIQ
ncbi:MAG: DUF1896 domain-containing protein [Prevotellaceae bacterium]|jgi:hypothetical protein|nr:DUF1896 domain-containing protein [Prevotellaceae bacterium]